MCEGRFVKLSREALIRSNEGGFSTTFQMTDLLGKTEDVKGVISNHSNVFEPENMTYTVGSVVFVAFNISTLTQLGFDIFGNVEKNTTKMKGWALTYQDKVLQTTYHFSCTSSQPDFSLNLVNCEMTLKKTS